MGSGDKALRTARVAAVLAAGPRGLPGASGSAGAAGPSGPSDAYIDRNESAALPAAPSSILLAELHLAPGPYAIHFTGHPYLGSGATWVDCVLRVANAQLNKTAVYIGGNPEATIEADAAIADLADVSANAPVRASCPQRVNGSANIADVRLHAIAVATLTAQ